MSQKQHEKPKDPHWNYRLMAHTSPGLPSEVAIYVGDDEVYLEMHEVHYDADGIPRAYGEEPTTVSGDSAEEIRWVLEKMQEAALKPILWAGEKWPQEYIPKQKENGNKTDLRAND